MREEVDLGMQFSHGDGNHIPQIFRHDVCGHEIDLAGGIAAVVAAALDNIVRVYKTPGGLDLNAPEFLSGVEDEIVAFAVSPDSSYAKAEAGGFGEKGTLGGFAVRLPGGEADGLNLDRRYLQ